MRINRILLPSAGLLAAAALMAFGSAPAAFADSTTSTAAPSYCNTATTTAGYFATTDQSSYGTGQTLNFCLTENGQAPLMLGGTHPWQVRDMNGNVVFMPDMGTTTPGQAGTTFFADSWNGMNASSTNMAAGQYQVVFNGFTGSPSATFTLTGTSTTSTGTTTATSTPSTSGDVSALVSQLETLQGQYPAFAMQLQTFINSLTATSSDTGGSTGGSMNASIDQNGQSYGMGGSIDFVGRNFSREQDVTVTMNGQAVAHAHADGGGNFSTGSISLPSTAGSYTYAFTDSAGDMVHATIMVH